MAYNFNEIKLEKGMYSERGKSFEQTLEIGWKLLAELPRAELKRIRDAYLEKYYDQKEG